VRKAPQRRIGTIEIGFRLVRVLERADGPLQLKELSERAGMAPSKAHAYVTSFVHEGLLERDETSGRYGLGPMAMSLGVAALRQSDLVAVTRREAAALSDATTCSVILSTWGNQGPVIVFYYDGKRRAPTSFRIGYVYPMSRSATGRVFAAYLPAHETAALLEADADERKIDLTAEFARIRADGFAVTGESDEFTGIGAPIIDHQGQIVAVLTLSRPYENNTRERRAELGRYLSMVAAKISKQIGHDSKQRAAKGTAKIS
jgi:DNA-binding IclR family transcriptional regulator